MPYQPAVTAIDYYVAASGDPAFIPGNCQAPTSSHDNPDNGTKAERQASCEQVSPMATVVVAS